MTSQKKPFQLSNDTIYELLKAKIEHLQLFSDKTLSNGFVKVSRKDYKNFPPLKALLFTRFVILLFDDDMETLKLKNLKNRFFMMAYENWENRNVLRLFPYVQINKLNARFTPSNGGELHFNVFEDEGEWKFTCENFDVVAHETSHANLHISCPDFNHSHSMQTKALHEAWADLTVIFSLLKVAEIRQKFLEETDGNLLSSTFISMIGEPLKKGREIRNAVNFKNMDNVPQKPHDQSTVFTAAIYEVLAKVFVHLQRSAKNLTYDQMLETAVDDVRLLLLEALLTIEYSDPSFADIGRRMMQISKENGWPVVSSFIDQVFLKKGIDIDLSHEDQTHVSLPFGSNHSCCCQDLLSSFEDQSSDDEDIFYQ